MRERIEQWKSIFQTDENSICKQLSGMAWDLAVFTCLVEAIDQAPDGPQGKQLNGVMVSMLANGFWHSAFLGVRKLADKHPIGGARGVCSIGGLIADAKAARQLITRRVFVEEIAGLNYDYVATRARFEEFVRAHPAGTIVSGRRFNEELSIRRHLEFDTLSGTTEQNRTADDVIREDFFVALEQRMARLEGVVTHTHIDVAHAATEASRAGRQLESWQLTDAKNAFRDLAQTAEILGSALCYDGIGSVLPRPQFDQFEHIEQPLFSGDPAVLHAKWDELSAEITRWHDVSEIRL
ncbi:hypothetical protein I5U02_09580 [Stenotrophomonas maltophilia]|nr:hypothetical protein [Stenotrophomonas maltophilia]